VNSEQRLERITASCALEPVMVVDGVFTLLVGLHASLAFVPAMWDTLERTA